MACRRDQEATADWPDSGISGYSWSSEKEDVSALFLWGSSHQWRVSHSSPGSGERRLASSEFGETESVIVCWVLSYESHCFFLPWGISWNSSNYSSAKLRIRVLFSHHTTETEYQEAHSVGGSQSRGSGKVSVVEGMSALGSKDSGSDLSCCLPVTVLLVHYSPPRASGSLALKCIW